MEYLESLIENLSKLDGVMCVAVADDTGSFVAGKNVDDPDEFAAILAFIGAGGETLEDLLGFKNLEFISLSGKTNKLIVNKVKDYFVGVQLKNVAIVSKLETSIRRTIKNIAP